MTKHIFVFGGVLSSLGKGIAASSIGLLLKKMNYKIYMQKLDPYLNVDPGTMSPYQHGEVFVTDDGAETDLDLGHYERFIDIPLNKNANFTSGKIYKSVIDKERRGDYLGKTVQVIPHITDEIKKIICSADKDNDIIITEVGGTIGDIESYQFLEAIRQFSLETPKNDCLFILLTYVPFIKAAGELKTKPTQHASIKLRELGIQPDILLCRSEKWFDNSIKEKIALFTNVRKECVINAIDVPYIYEVPFNFMKQNLHKLICENLNLKEKEIDLSQWEVMINCLKIKDKKINIALCGKYVSHKDAYKSIVESLYHAAAQNKIGLEIVLIDTEKYAKLKDTQNVLNNIDAVLVPGGFGARGTNGMIDIIKVSREKQIPFFGICFGMHMAVIEFAKNVCLLKDAISAEFEQKSENEVVHIMEDQKYIENYGGSMRLGSYPCLIKENTLAKKIYSQDKVQERHRHRYEFNNAYREIFTEKGMLISGVSPDNLLAEIVEISNHPFFIGVQFHPEFKSRPTNPHPIFNAFVKAAIDYNKNNLKRVGFGNV